MKNIWPVLLKKSFKLKLDNGLFKNRFVDDVDINQDLASPQDFILNEKLVEKSITVLKNK